MPLQAAGPDVWMVQGPRTSASDLAIGFWQTEPRMRTMSLGSACSRELSECPTSERRDSEMSACSTFSASVLSSAERFRRPSDPLEWPAGDRPRRESEQAPSSGAWIGGGSLRTMSWKTI